MARLFATLNDDKDAIELERTTPNAPWSLKTGTPPDLVQTGPGQFSLIHNTRNFRVLVLKEDRENNIVRLRIGAHLYSVKLEDEQRHLIKEMGLDKSAHSVVRELKAPMPGLVLKLLVKEGDKVKKNDPVLVLEAMKMENVIKAPGEATVGRVHVSERTAVEKGQLLLAFS